MKIIYRHEKPSKSPVLEQALKIRTKPVKTYHQNIQLNLTTFAHFTFVSFWDVYVGRGHITSLSLVNERHLMFPESEIRRQEIKISHSPISIGD